MKNSRRNFLASLAATTAGGLLLNQKGLAQVSAKKSDKISLIQDGTYETVPLTKQSLSLGVVQSRVGEKSDGRLARSAR